MPRTRRRASRTGLLDSLEPRVLLSLTPIVGPVGPRIYYVAPVPGSGSGTAADPFGLADLPQPGQPGSGRALETLQPGDTLWFRPGEYHLRGQDGNAWERPILTPTRPGLPGAPITFASAPDARAVIIDDGGGNPLAGSTGMGYVRFIGLELRPGGIQPAVRITGYKEQPPLAGIEIADCRIVGRYVATVDNHDGIRLDSTLGAYVHHNEVSEIRGDSGNSTGIKLYSSSEARIEANYVHDSEAGISDKDSGTRNVFRGNVIVRNARVGFRGNNQGRLAVEWIEGNVLDQPIQLPGLTASAVVVNNLVYAESLVVTSYADSTGLVLLNNTLVTPTSRALPVVTHLAAWDASPAPLVASAGNVYLAANGTTPSVAFQFGTYLGDQSRFLDLATMQAAGFEAGSRADAGSPGAADDPRQLLAALGVVRPNAPPMARDDAATTPLNRPVVINVLANDADSDDNLDPATLAVLIPPTHGRLRIDPITHVATYAPRRSFKGWDAFTYRVHDAAGSSSQATVTIRVSGRAARRPPRVGVKLQRAGASPVRGLSAAPRAGGIAAHRLARN